MNQSDTLYRALVEYRKETATNQACVAQCGLLASTDSESGKIETSRVVCLIDETWVLELEKGLVFVEKAIKSERQFIQSHGTVDPIEKMKRVSRESVVHLARHSNLITKKSKNGDFVPDRLYTVERQSDFAVYENRFLYLLLCYARDFTEIRYNKILELTNTYLGRCIVNKTVLTGKNKLSFKLKLIEERQNDRHMRESNALQKTVDRIDIAMRQILHFLDTPLMQEVAKTPLIKTPITKTNVLKMNQNFRGATELYEFLTAYDKPGFTIRKKTERKSPLSERAAAEFAEVVGLVSFLTYEYGLGLEDSLKAAYESEEARRKAENERICAERFEQLRRRIDRSGGDTQEYLLLLEERNKLLEEDRAQLAGARQELEKTRIEADSLAEMIRALRVETEAKRNEAELMNKKHRENLASEKLAHEKRIGELDNLHSFEITELNTEHGNAVLAISEMHRAELAERELRIAECEQRIVEDQALSKRMVAEAEKANATKLAEVRDLYREKTGHAEMKLSESIRVIERMSDEKSLSDARLLAIKKENNLFSADENFTTQASFGELEHQYKVFREFFKAEWKKTKRQIREKSLKNSPVGVESNNGELEESEK